MIGHAVLRKTNGSNLQGEVEDNLAPEQPREQVFSDDEIRHAFQTFDLDKNSMIGVSELKHVLTLIGENASDEEIDKMIRMADTEGMGQVSFDGFYRLFASRIDSANTTDIEGRQDDQPSTALPNPATNNVHAKLPLSAVLRLYSQKKSVTPAYIRTAYKKCVALDVEKTGRLSYLQMHQVLDMADIKLTYRLFECVDPSTASDEVDIKRVLVTLLVHTENKIKAMERVRIAFSLMRSNGQSDNSLNKDQLQELLIVFFKPYEEDATLAQDMSSRLQSILEYLKGSNISFDQFMDLVFNQPERILPAPLVQQLNISE